MFGNTKEMVKIIITVSLTIFGLVKLYNFADVSIIM